MKFIASAAPHLAGAGFRPELRGANPSAGQQNNRDTMIMPSTQNQSPRDFNHMGAGSDKSDELGVPYYNHDL